MIGEYAGGGYASNGNTLGTGEMDSDLDFDFNDQATNFVKGNISSVESFLTSRNSVLNNTYMTGQFLGSHDEDGFKQKLLDGGMAEDAATAASMVAASLQITAKGQPVIYYGEEIGQTGLNNYPYQTNRYDFDWSIVSNDNKTYQHYKKMLSIRNAYTDVFARGDRKTILASDENGYDIVSRSYKETKLYVGLNIKDVAQTVEIPVSENNGTVLKDLYSGKTYTVSNGKIKVIIPAATDGGTVVLKNNSSTNGGSTGGSSSSGSTTTETKPSEDTKKDATTTESVIPAEKLPEGTTATVTVTKTKGCKRKSNRRGSSSSNWKDKQNRRESNRKCRCDPSCNRSCRNERRNHHTGSQESRWNHCIHRTGKCSRRQSRCKTCSHEERRKDRRTGSCE